MLYLRMSLIAMALTMVGAAYFQEKKDDKKTDDKKTDDKPPAVKLKGPLPTHYNRLGRRDDQVQKILKIRLDYRTKQDELKAKMDKLKVEEKELLEKALTPDQLKRLREIKSGDKPSDKVP